MPSLAVTPDELEAFRRLSLESLLLAVLIQLAVIILAARVFGVLARRFGQPSAVGEIAAGLLLGPSALGWAFPDLAELIFRPNFEGIPHALSDPLIEKIFAILSQIGLIFLLFLIGLEFEFSHLRWHGSSALAVSAAGVAVPFTLGLAITPLLLSRVEPHPEGGPVPALGFTLFLGVAMSITALPILGRMMIEWGITRTKLGVITISAAAVNDAIGWILLAAIAATVRRNFDLGGTALMTMLSIGFGLFMAVGARPWLLKWARAALRRGNGELGLNDLVILLVILFLCAIATNWIGIFAIFGAFILGAVLSSETEFHRAVVRRLSDLVTSFFLPIFFTYTGLRTNVRSLGPSAEMWLLGGLVLAAAVVGKFGGCGLAARLSGYSWRESGCIGVMMNTRALMELIVINLGYELRVIPLSVFCTLVLMALITTVMTTPILMRLIPGTELDEPIRRSGFLGTTAGGTG